MTYPYAPPQVPQVVRPPGNGLAVSALVLGIIAVTVGIWMLIPIVGFFVVFTAGPCAVLAIVLGHFGVVRARVVGVGRGQALTGLVLGYVTMGIAVGCAVFWIVTIALSGTTA